MRTVRRIVVVGALLAAAMLPAGAAQAVPEHLHCITTPGGTHSIGRGVTLKAPHEPAFDNFHGNVHVGAFATNPIPISADFQAPYSC